MKKRQKIAAIAGGIVLAATGGLATVAAAGGGPDSDTPISGSALTEAKAAALDATGGGKVTGTEVGDEESYYEVEVTLDDGSQVDVQLDRSFGLVKTMPDHEDANQPSG